MARPPDRPHPSADPHPGRRGRSGIGGLAIGLIIAVVALVAFLLYDNSGWRTPPEAAVTADGEPAETEAPSGTEAPEPAVPDLAPEDAPVETDPPAEGDN